MILLKIDNSECKLSGLTDLQYKQLKELMSYEIDAGQAHHSKQWFNRKKTLMSKTGVFPTGLLYIAIDWVIQHNLDNDIKVQDLRIRPRMLQDRLVLDLKGVAARKEQLDAAKAAVENDRGIITAPTGSGKSMIVSLIINKLQVPTLVVVPSLELRKQLTASLKEHYGAGNVGRISDKRPIAVENVDSIKLTRESYYNCVIIDEFHHSGAETYRKLNKKAWSSVYYKFGLTATPLRSNENEKLLLESVLSKVIYKLDYATSVENGYIVPIQVYWVEVPKVKMEEPSNNWASVYSQLVVNNTARNELIQKLLLKFHANSYSTLCLVKEIGHGTHLSGDGAFPFVNGQNDERHLIEAFSEGKTKTLIGTTGIIGEGVDTRACEVVLIAGGGKAKVQFMQACGRGFRRFKDKESCKIILLKDTSHKYLLKHFLNQVKIVKEEYGINPVQLILE